MKTVTMNLKNGTIEEWSVDQLSRWMCLVEAYDIIHQKADELGLNMGDMVSSKAIEEYIYGSSTVKKFDGRLHSMRHDVGVEVDLGLL